MPSLNEVRQEVEGVYRQRTPKSAQLFERARQVMPGGDTRASTYYRPYPTVIDSGDGAYLYDVDGNSLLDFLNNYTSLVHGNAFTPIAEAVAKQLKQGTAWAAPNVHQILLASLIRERVPSVGRLRFTNSGTEATMQAIRVARAFSGREAIVKVEGGYHGTHEAAGVSIEPDLAQAGPADVPLSLPSDPGILAGTLAVTHVVPYNNSAALEQTLTSFHAEIAAVIMEPMLGSRGMIPADEDYLRFTRQITRKYDTLLILDEVMTLRLDLGGAQALYGVEPDLSTFAKIIGGGFPVGAFGGREEIMELYNPSAHAIHHGGTFNANPVGMVAGVVAMEHLNSEKIEFINKLGAMLREGLQEVLTEQGLLGQITGRGSLAGIHLTPEPVKNYRNFARVPRALRELLHLSCLNMGLFISPEGMLNTSTAMTVKDVHQSIQAVQEAFVTLRPAIEAQWPHILR